MILLLSCMVGCIIIAIALILKDDEIERLDKLVITAILFVSIAILLGFTLSQLN